MLTPILVTGFGRFPGIRDNPTAALVHALGAHRARLIRLGIELELAVLPVTYAGVAKKLAELDELLKPGAIVHFGLAARRKFLSIETRALNRLNLLRCDASGACASRFAIVPGAPQTARSTFPARQIEAALRRAGLHARLSVKAGTYVCNESLYLTLTHAQAGAAGFIHVPQLACAHRPKRAARSRRLDLAALVRAALITILVTARKRRNELAQHDGVQTPGKCLALERAADA